MCNCRKPVQNMDIPFLKRTHTVRHGRGDGLGQQTQVNMQRSYSFAETQVLPKGSCTVQSSMQIALCSPIQQLVICMALFTTVQPTVAIHKLEHFSHAKKQVVNACLGHNNHSPVAFAMPHADCVCWVSRVAPNGTARVMFHRSRIKCNVLHSYATVFE